MTYIPLADCKRGTIYSIHSRNLGVGVYDGANGFIGIREKCGSEYLFTEYHWDQGPPFGTVKPTKVLGECPADIAVDENLRHEYKTDSTRWGERDSWAKRDGVWIPVVRRDLRPDEPQHGGRQGFVDEWADTGERLGDNQWPCLRQNEALFNLLKTY